MSIAFLSTTAAVPSRSPLADVAAAAGGVLDTRHGWVVPVSFAATYVEAAACRSAIGWADASQLGKLELVDGAARPTGVAIRDDHGWWCPITSRRGLRLLDPGAMATHERVGPGVVDVTTQLAGLRLIGPAAREAIARFCAIDLRPRVAAPGSFHPGSIARTPGYVLCESADAYLLLFGAAYAQYLWTVVSDAGGRLGGRPIGTDTADAFVAPRNGVGSYA